MKLLVEAKRIVSPFDRRVGFGPLCSINLGIIERNEDNVFMKAQLECNKNIFALLEVFKPIKLHSCFF